MIQTNFHKLAPIERNLKVAIQELLNDEMYKLEITDDIRKNFEQYLSTNLQYFVHDQYIGKNLEVLFAAMHNFYFTISRGYFLHKKQLLDYQSELLESPEQFNTAGLGYGMQESN